MERRQGARRRVSFEVLLSSSSVNTLLLQAADISNVGIYLLSEGIQLPPIGSVVQVKLNGSYGSMQEELPQLDMVIKRTDSKGIGLQYLKSP